ncbi:MAG: AraC family transcriptional regulator [Cyclobacteriaceae bacterium]|nr:AraC family transcriptional regulator [Cyclobacteriaceae bacterium]
MFESTIDLAPFIQQLIVVITYAGIVLGVFVVFVINNQSVRKSRATRFLSILLLSLSFSISHILFAGLVLNHFSAQVFTLGDPTYFLLAPLLWLYAKELMGERVAINTQLLTHFIPFLITILLSLTLKSSGLNLTHLHMLDQQYRVIDITFGTILLMQFSWYQFLIRQKWAIFRRQLQQEVSNQDHVDVSWVRFFMLVFLVLNLFFLFSLFATIHLPGGSWLALSTAFLFSICVFALGYKGIVQRELVLNSDLSIKEEPKNSIEKNPFIIDHQLLNQLREYMNTHKPFLNSELTLSELAKNLNISRSQLSALINEGIGDNFYDFINKYRVEEVKRLMVDPAAKNFNLLGIALEAGFKSKSTFNLIFKRFTGLTPTEYRKNKSSEDVQ